MPRTLKAMFDCPPASQTSPTRMLRIVTVSPPQRISIVRFRLLASKAGNMACHTPCVSVSAVTVWPANDISTVLPGVAVPSNGSGMSRWSTMLSQR